MKDKLLLLALVGLTLTSCASGLGFTSQRSIECGVKRLEKNTPTGFAPLVKLQERHTSILVMRDGTRHVIALSYEKASRTNPCNLLNFILN